MKSTIILLLSAFLLFSCSTHSDNDVIYAVVKHDTIVKTEEAIPPPPPLLKPFYGNYNFILLDSSKIFYHKKNKHYACGVGLDRTKPFLISLAPEDLKEIKITELTLFLKSIPDTIISDWHFYASISSPKDTIRNNGYKIIADFFKSRNIKNYNTRNLTEEEHYALTAKLENKKYDPHKVNWKVGFGDVSSVSVPADTNWSTKKDSLSIWVYDYETRIPIKNRKVKADTLTPGKLIHFINVIAATITWTEPSTIYVSHHFSEAGRPRSVAFHHNCSKPKI